MMANHDIGAATKMVVQASLGLFLLATSVLKVISPSDLQAALKELGLRSDHGDVVVTSQAARAIALAEAALGCGLLAGSRWAAGLTSIFILGASCVLILLWRRGFDGNCGCFGAMEIRSGLSARLGLNLMLLGAAVYLWWPGRSPNDALRPLWEQPEKSVPLLAGGVVLIVGFAVLKDAFPRMSVPEQRNRSLTGQ